MFPMMQSNPMLDMWMKSFQAFSPAFGNIYQPMVQPQANPIAQIQQAFQQNMLAWQNMWMPTAQPEPNGWPSPKITVMTIELGDMKPYMEAANSMLQQWQPMMAGMMRRQR